MHIDFSNWGDHRDLEPYLTLIKISLQENKVLSFEYINHSGNQTKRQVEPYQLILKNSQWYFQGYCYKRNDFRLFKLSRISNLQIKNRTFIPKINPDPLLDTTEILTKLRITIKLRIHESILERILDYCDYENFSKDDKSHYIVNFPFIENDYYYSMLLGFGDQCECLGPLHVRSTLKEKIKNLSRIYES
ncbi:helix-turn-helix transcriptional regulator [Leuconostoc sp. JNUCC 76]